MKVLFLDIDGVLNSTAWSIRRDPGRCPIDPVAMGRLNRVLRETSAVVVVSSSWRIGRRIVDLRAVLREHGLEGQVIGVTPYLARADLPRILPEERAVERGEEIRVWLDSHPEVECFAVVDDDSDMDLVRDRFVQTCHEDGLQDEHADRLIALLGRAP